MKVIFKNSELIFQKKARQTYWNVENDGEKRYFIKNSPVGEAIVKTENASAANIVITDVVEGDVFTVTSKAGNSAKPWAFINASDKVISCSSAEPGIVVTNERVVAPAGVVKAIFNIYDDVTQNFALLEVHRIE